MNKKRPFTGGELNHLNEVLGLSTAAKTVPVMKLIKHHKPATEAELVELIKNHIPDNRSTSCPCGCVSTGTVGDFGDELYEAQLVIWDNYKYSRTDCRNWMYDLFITNSLKGASFEEKARRELQSVIGPGYLVTRADQDADKNYRVDLEIYMNEHHICGIQIKPESYRNVNKKIKDENIRLNEKYSKNVYYFYYSKNGEFIFSPWA